MMDDGILVIISLMIMDGSNKGHQNRNQVHSRYKKAFLKSLGYGRGKFLDAVFTVMHVLLLKFIVSRGRVAWQ